MGRCSVFIAFTLLFTCCSAARILGVFPTVSKSHLIVHAAITDALADAGHDVTVLSNWPNVYKKAKYNYVRMNTTMDTSFFATTVNTDQKPNPIFQMLNMTGALTRFTNESLANEIRPIALQMHKQKPFDLVILGYFLNEFYVGLGAELNCPIAVSVMIRPILTVNNLIGNPLEASYVPAMNIKALQPLTFWDRVLNFVMTFVEQQILGGLLNYFDHKFYNYHFPADRYPSLDEMRKNVSLVLTNHHFSQGPIRPNVPALIEIGGIQIKEKPDPLPKDLDEIMTNAKNGIIYFSLGSNVQGSILPKEKAKIMFDVLSKLPYTVLWKWGESDFPGTAPNIIYRSWLPQDDILAHPNVKLFITHGGQGSVVESQYHGVPMVGMPLFGDQPANMANVVRSGFGVSLSYVDLTEADFAKAIDEVLNNPKYSDAIKTFSRLYRDRPMTARQSVVYWVEYVIRHKGAKHMQSPAVHMNSLQLMSLDVIGFLAAIVGVVVLIFVKLCKFICCRGKGSKRAGDSKVTKSKKNK